MNSYKILLYLFYIGNCAFMWFDGGICGILCLYRVCCKEKKVEKNRRDEVAKWSSP